MGTDIKLKDLFGQTQTEQDISTISVPKADGTGREFYVKRPVIYYRLVASPPYAPQEGDNNTIFWNLGDGGFLTELDIGNCMGGYHEAVEGKTTKPIVRVVASKYLEGISADNSGSADLVYLEEAVPGQTLIDILFGGTGTADFTAQPGWGQLIQGADGQTYTYTQLTDLSSIAIGIEQPNNIFNQRLFYSYLTEKTNSAVAYTAAKNGAHTIVPPAESSGISTVNLTVDVPEPNLQDKSVAITENGTQEFSADTGYDGIKKLTATVNVAGGGGTGVQPDYAQNNTTAADYIKNRPGGYMIEYPSITKTFTGTTDDPNYVDFGDGAAFLFTTDLLPNNAILNATGKVTGKVTGSDGTTTKTENIGSIMLAEDMEPLGALFAVFIAGKSEPVAVVYSIKQTAPDMPETISTGVYLIGLSQGESTIYISEFTSAAVAEPAVIDEKYLAIKSSNWGIPSKEFGKGYISSRIGGFWEGGQSPWQFDGDLNGKDVVDVSDGYKFVKISDDAVPLDYAARGYISRTDFGSGTYFSESLSRSNITILPNGGGFVIMSGVFPGIPAGETRSLAISVQIPYITMEEIKYTQGTWFLYRAGSGDTPAHYISDIGSGANDSIVRIPYEFVEPNPNTLTADDINKLIDTKLGVIENGSY